MGALEATTHLSRVDVTAEYDEKTERLTIVVKQLGHNALRESITMTSASGKSHPLAYASMKRIAGLPDDVVINLNAFRALSKDERERAESKAHQAEIDTAVQAALAAERAKAAPKKA